MYRWVRGAFYAPPKIKSTVFYATLFKWFNFQQTGYQTCKKIQFRQNLACTSSHSTINRLIIYLYLVDEVIMFNIKGIHLYANWVGVKKVLKPRLNLAFKCAIKMRGLYSITLLLNAQPFPLLSCLYTHIKIEVN